MDLREICSDDPSVLAVLSFHGIDDVPSLRDVFSDPAALVALARDLKAGPLARLRKRAWEEVGSAEDLVEVLRDVFRDVGISPLVRYHLPGLQGDLVGGTVEDLVSLCARLGMTDRLVEAACAERPWRAQRIRSARRS